MRHTNRIFAFHLLNDRSGSPKVLSQIIKGWVNDGMDIHLYTSLYQEGFLSGIEGVSYHNGWYRFKENPWIRLLFYTLSQLILIGKMYRKIKKTDIVYINTVLPFGAALLGKIKGCRVIYHIHESTVNPAILKWFLFKIVKWSASEIINVSKYVEKSHGIKNVPNHLVYNAIDEYFLLNLLPKEESVFRPSRVLMVCSLKAYKGVFEFIQLAADFPQYQFRLVLNATQTEINSFFGGVQFPDNLTLFPSQSNLHPFFQWADIIVNLSRPDAWIETFGLTIIEGMAYGLPAIVPPVGGILEVIEEGVTGFSVDSRNSIQLNDKLSQLLSNTNDYKTCAREALKRLNHFKEAQMLLDISAIINGDFRQAL
jgi:glycosyltransferase involved in cell wall biosynthesis